MNVIMVNGRLGKEPTLQYVGNNNDALCTFSIAHDRWDSKNKTSITDWYEVTTWRRVAEYAAEKLTKGSSIKLVGELAMEQWEDRDGNKRITAKITADRVAWDFHEPKKQEEGRADDPVKEWVEDPNSEIPF